MSYVEDGYKVVEEFISQNKIRGVLLMAEMGVYVDGYTFKKTTKERLVNVYFEETNVDFFTPAMEVTSLHEFEIACRSYMDAKKKRCTWARIATAAVFRLTSADASKVLDKPDAGVIV